MDVSWRCVSFVRRLRAVGCGLWRGWQHETHIFHIFRQLADKVVNAEQARIAEEAGAVAVMALERVPADIRKDGTLHTCFLLLASSLAITDRPVCVALAFMSLF
jgi:hypothetical protein